MKKLWTEGKNKLVIAGSCILIIFTIGAVIYSNVTRTEQRKEKVSAVSQTVQDQKNEENTVTEQESTQVKVSKKQEESKKSVEEKQEDLEHSDTQKSVDSEGKKKKETEEGQEKRKEKGDSVKKDSKNKKDETKEQSQEKQEEPKTEREVSQSPKQREAGKEEKNYVPISEGWKDAKSAKGDITFAQKAALDAMVETWKSGSLSDSELKTKIMEYLEDQKITCTEVSVTSQGYALYSQVPEIELSDGGNYYSFVGTYSTGKQNPEGTEKTIFYNWSVFVF